MISAIILAAGKGERFDSYIPKPFMSLNGKPVIQYSIDVLEKFVDEIIIAANASYKNYKTVKGGKRRCDSVYNGLLACNNPDYVIVHDGVRPFLAEETVQNIIEKLKQGYKNVDTAVKVIDGLLQDGIPVSKKPFMLSQTPEGFEFKTLLRAHELRIKYDPDFDYQDDVSVVYKFCGIPVEIVEGVYINSKITFGDDLIYSEAIMKVRHKPIKTEPNLEGKKILVFGGSGGIGSRVVELLKEKGAKVYVPTRQEVDLNQRLPDSLKDNWDGIVHCAGAYGTDDDFNYEEIMNVNFRSALDCLGLMTKGNIVFVGSTAGFYGRENITVYSASKAALNSLVESKAEELAQKGIYINCICPAKVATPLQERINPGTPKSEMMDPKQVAEIIIKYLDTKVYGQIIYLKVGKNF